MHALEVKSTMIISRLLKQRFTSILITLFITLQISACGTEENLAASAADINPDTITGTDTDTNTNHAAVFSGVDSASVVEDVTPGNMLQVGGKLNVTDLDAGEAAFITITASDNNLGNYGQLVITSEGDWWYYANNNQTVIQNLARGATLTDSLTVSSVDGTTHTIVITIIGVDEAATPPTNTNQAALISGVDAGSVIEDVDPDSDSLLEVGAKLNITDSNAGEAAFIANTVNGNYGSLIINTVGNWNYAADNNQTVIQNLATGATLNDSLTVSSVDGTTHTVKITILGADEANINNPAVISGINTGNVTEDIDPDSDNLLEVGAKLNITDSDAGEAAFTANTVNGNYGSLIIDTAGNWNYAADNNQAVIQNLATGATLSDSLKVSSVDGTTHTVKITIAGADEANPIFANVSLSWVAPSQREDGTPLSLSEITGYKVYYGTAQGQYPNSTTINDSTAVGHTFTNLPAGTYYFVVTTIDTEDRESGYSPEIKKAT
jgi:VCBS repeat-containing protein